MLPIIAYFGRMLDHTSPVQFFSLLMLHGYLQWTGTYGSEYSRKTGVLCYALGAILGIATGWAAVIMATLVWLWHITRTFGNSLQRKILLWTAIIPAVSLAAVILHISWGCRWKIKWLGSLLLSRTISPQHPIPWSEWSSENYTHLRENFSDFAIVAAIIYSLITLVMLCLRDSKNPLLQKITPAKISGVPVLLTAMQGLIWIFIFKHQSSRHDYWQYLLTPFFAVAIAAVLQESFILLSEWMPKTAKPLILLLAMSLIPPFAYAYDMLYQYQFENRRDEAAFFKKLSQLIPPRTAVMASEKLPQRSETYGDYTNYWTEPHLAYYINRPVIHTTDINEIRSNRQGCAAYIMRLTDDPNLQKLAMQLNIRYEQVSTEQNVYVFLLNQPKNK